MKKIRGAVSVFFLCALIGLSGGVGVAYATNDTAGGWSASGTDYSASSGGGCGCKVGDPDCKCCKSIDEGQGYAIDCTGLSWVRYESWESTNKKTYLPHTNNHYVKVAGTNEDAFIDSSCSNGGKGGFWVFGRNAANVGFYMVNSNNSEGLTDKQISIAGKTFRFDGIWAPVTWSNSYEGSNRYMKNPIHGSRAQKIGSYKAVESTNTTNTVLEAYNKYLQYNNRSTVKSLPNGLYAFCYWEDMSNKYKISVYAMDIDGNFINTKGQVVEANQDGKHPDAKIGSSEAVEKGKKASFSGVTIDGYAFVGWATTQENAKNGTYMTRKESELGNNDNNYLTNLSSAIPTFNRRNMSSNYTIYAVYTPVYELTAQADTNSWVKVIRSSSKVYKLRNRGEETIAKREYVNGVSNSVEIYKGDTLYYDGGATGSCISLTEQTVNGAYQAFGQSWTVSGKNEVKVSSGGSDSKLIVKYITPDGAGISEHSDVVIGACSGGGITYKRDSMTGYAFMGWRESPTGGYITNTSAVSSGSWIDGSRNSLDVVDGSLNRSYGTYHYNNLSGEKTVYAVYVKQFQLRISTDGCSTASVYRSASPNAGVSTGQLSDYAKIYDGDKLDVSFGNQCTCFDLLDHTINGSTYAEMTKGYVVSSNTTVVAGSYLRQYSLSKAQGDGTKVKVVRTSSPYTYPGVKVNGSGGSRTLSSAAGSGVSGDLADGDDIYCGDILNASFTLDEGYTWSSESKWHFVGKDTDTWGPSEGTDSGEIIGHVVGANVEASANSKVRTVFNGRASVVAANKANDTGWLYGSDWTANVDNVLCYDNGGCWASFKLEVSRIKGTDSTPYSVYKKVGNGGWGYVTSGTAYQSAEYDGGSTIKPGQTICYSISFHPLGEFSDTYITEATACATAEYSIFEGNIEVGNTGTGFRSTSSPSNSRVVYTIDCPVTGCKATFNHYLRRVHGSGGWSEYTITRESNYGTKGVKVVGSGKKTSFGGNDWLLKDTVDLSPGVVVCESLEFTSENNTPMKESTITACASALGKAQPDDPQNNSSEPTSDQGGSYSGYSTSEDIFLNILVKNSSVMKYSNYQKLVYAKPGDEVVYRSVYNPKLQYAYNLRPENLSIDGRAVLTSYNWLNPMSTLFRSYSGYPWMNAYGDSGVVSMDYTSYRGGDTSFKSNQNKYSVRQNDVGMGLIEFAKTNESWSTKLTPSQIYFTDSGAPYHYNVANVITTQISRSAFVRVPYNFVTKPAVSNTGGSTLGSGESGSVGISIALGGKTNCVTQDNCGSAQPYTTDAKDVKYQVVTYDPATLGTATSGDYGGGRNANVCDLLFGSNSGGRCNVVKADNVNTVRTTTPFSGNVSFEVPDKKAGSQMCVALAVFPATSGNDDNWRDTNYDGRWRVAESRCYTIVKKPSFQAWGGNVFVAGQINTSISPKTNVEGFPNLGASYRVFGSWSELGIIASGAINNMGSGASMGYVSNSNGVVSPNPTGPNAPGTDPGGFAGNNSSVCVRSFLTLANACNSAGVGNLGASGNLAQSSDNKSSILARFKDVDAENLSDSHADGNLGGLLNNVAGTHNYVYDRSDKRNVSLGGGVLKKGPDANTVTMVLVRIKGNLTINGNISYEDTQYSTLSGIPKLVLYVEKVGESDGNINISCGVDRIDALLVADGTVDTCSDGPKNSSGNPNRDAAEYSKQLKVNGAIIANKLILNRTYGAASGANSIVPAEIINYDPTLYLWGSAQSDMSNTGTLDVTYTLELSPRYGTE